MAHYKFSQSPNKTYVLVHGAGHGAWCWKKIIPVLEANGYQAVALDLPSRGSDPSKLANITLIDDVKRVTDIANATDGHVILVGHSSGGVIISQAADLLGAKKVDKLIYLDAFLPQNGESVFSLAEKIGQNKEGPSVAKQEMPAPERFLFTEDKKSFKWNPELVQQLFYHDCSQEDITFAQKNLTWNSVASIATPVNVSDDSYGVIKKYYILCAEARDLDKSSMVTNVQCEKVYKLPSGHSPFLSMPGKLVDILIEMY
ncbi:alpha/beta fold hydrolase [Niabella sp.]|uniref:alpha/beta fold hydrolase n=1 Tax=Niabella sp. TaxID=1962976 RepID=UPI00262C2B25|nr:alpha/beta fold hydrolase [Niabella sp.]